jgi:hypothetical protein
VKRVQRYLPVVLGDAHTSILDGNVQAGSEKVTRLVFDGNADFARFGELMEFRQD